MNKKEIETYIYNIWNEFKIDLSEYMSIKQLQPIHINFEVYTEDIEENMKADAATYSISCCYEIYNGIERALELRGLQDKKDKYIPYMLKIIFWHETFHILLGHNITKDDKKRLKDAGEEVVLRQLEYIADAMALRNNMPFIITNYFFSEDVSHEEAISEFMTMMYVYYLRRWNIETITKMPPQNHPRAGLRMKLFLYSLSVFVQEWNGIINDDTIDTETVRELFEKEIEKWDDFLDDVKQNEVDEIVDIRFDHWVWNERIKPYDQEFDFFK